MNIPVKVRHGGGEAVDGEVVESPLFRHFVGVMGDTLPNFWIHGPKVPMVLSGSYSPSGDPFLSSGAHSTHTLRGHNTFQKTISLSGDSDALIHRPCMVS